MLLGIISDTHGLMRPEALDALSRSAMIIHAGDVGEPAVLDRLRDLAPVVAVHGNIDRGSWAASLPQTALVAAGAYNIYVLHDLSRLAVDPLQANVAVVVYGHSHKPAIETRHGIIYLNPGSAGPRRFRLPITLARLTVSATSLYPEIVPLPIA